MRNPNGYGTVARLSGNRRRPFIIKKTLRFDEKGFPVYEIIGYAATREEGNILLGQYNNDPWDVDKAKITFFELFELWKEKKAPKLGASNQASLYSVSRYCSKLFNRPYKTLKSYQMQETIDTCGKSYSTQASIKNLWGHLDRFALELDVITRCYSELLTSDPIPETTRDRFSDNQIKLLWQHEADPWVDSILVFLYAGWRISEFLNMKTSDVDLAAGTMKGGVKTTAGRGRVVPIHSLIYPIIARHVAEGNEYLFSYHGCRCNESQYRIFWKEITKSLAIEKTPHECRHTFESMLDSAGANRKCIDLMMGHVSKDTGNRVYNHKTLEELKTNIELIKLPT